MSRSHLPRPRRHNVTGPIPDDSDMCAVAVIDIATGVLMERRGCTPTQARTILSDASQLKHLMIRELAERIAADGDLC